VTRAVIADDGRTLTLPGSPLQEPAPRYQGRIDGRTIEFRLERRRRRSIGLRVDEYGLKVSAPLRAPWRDVESALHAHERWILQRLQQWAIRGRPQPLIGRSGETLPLAGAPVEIEVRPGRRSVHLHDARLVLCVPEPARHATVRALLVAWLKARTLQMLAPRAAHFAARIGARMPRVAVSNARRQWGVCTADGRIRLSWRLAHLAPELSDYVVAHETAHLVELNHSKRFWRLVESLYPDWRAARQRIRRAGATLPILQEDLP